MDSTSAYSVRPYNSICKARKNQSTPKIWILSTLQTRQAMRIRPCSIRIPSVYCVYANYYYMSFKRTSKCAIAK